MTGADLSPADHPHPAIKAVLKKLAKKKWKLRKEGHWGRLYCPCKGKCTTIPVSGTPRNPEGEARKIERLAARCPMKPGDSRRSLAGGLRKGLPGGKKPQG
jgi:hypothetical protein